MPIKRLNISDFRNFKNQSICFGEGINIFYGANGAGKTSVLEALNYVLTGRSFRTSNVKNTIRNSSDKSVVFLQVCNHEDGVLFNIGIEKSFSNTSLKLNNLVVSGISEIARILPVQVVEPSNLNILEGSPEGRRKFLDWLVFHVEHDFSQHWKRYKNILKQRNSLLRRGKIVPLELDVWDAQLATYGILITESRQKHLKELLVFITKYLELFGLDCVSNASFKYVRGWERGVSFIDALKSSRENDIRKSHTRCGPHRSDLKIEIDGKPVGEMLSRGQQKVFCICMKLAQCEYLRLRCGKEAVFLLDDMASELDTNNLYKVYESLEALGAQVLLTSIHVPEIPTHLIKRSNTMFHVEHGIISQKN